MEKKQTSGVEMMSNKVKPAITKVKYTQNCVENT